MANMVKFQRGLQEVYNRASKLDNVFYYTTDTKNLYLGEIKLSNGADLSAAIERIADNEEAIDILQQKIAYLMSDDGKTGFLVDMGTAIKANTDGIKAINDEIGLFILAYLARYTEPAQRTIIASVWFDHEKYLQTTE